MSGLSAFIQSRNLTSDAVISAAEAHARRYERALIESLVGAEMVPEDIVMKHLSDELGIARVSLEDCEPDPAAKTLLSAEACRRHLIFPIEKLMMDGFNFLLLAMADPLESNTIRFVYNETGLRIRPLLTAPSEICDAIARAYACAFEPLFGAAIDADDKNAGTSPQTDLSNVAIGFDTIENFLGPYLAGQERVELNERLAAKAISQCIDQSASSRDIILMRLAQKLIDSGQISVTELLTGVRSA